MSVATLPQVYQIYSTQNAEGVSALSWGYYTLFYLILLTYGFVHKETPIILTYSLCVILFAMIFVGAIIY